MLARNLTKLTNLLLDGINMSGFSPSSLLNFTSSLKRLSLGSSHLLGELPTEVFRLPYLQYLDLSFNFELTGHLPKSNWSSPLELLDISFCNFRGPLPSSLGNLTQIVSLYLVDNSFEGEIPDVFGSLKKLAGVLDLNSFNFSGPLPSTIFNLTQVTFINLSNNSVEGVLPARVGGLQNLEELDLSYNLISGAVPTWLFALPSLSGLDLHNNKLLTLPTDDQIQKPNSIKSIDLESNEIHGSIPSFLFDLVNLTYLDLSSNNLSGVITSGVLSKPKSLPLAYLYLNISYNSLTGLKQYPRQNLRTLDVRSNQLSGPLLAPPTSLRQFIISNNSLTGEIPTSICNLSSLKVLDLSINNLGGIIPVCLGNFSEFLFTVNLQMNSFVGQIPAFESFKLKTLALNENRLEGLLPRSLANCTSLRLLNVANNKLNDTFPHWLGVLPELQGLVLRSNRFHGPLENATAPSSFSNLEIIDLSQNGFTGTLPTNLLQDLKAIKFGNTTVTSECKSVYNRDCSDDYHEYVKVMIKRLQLELRLGTEFTVIDFSNNQFYGLIPEVIGELGSLLVLNLSHNQLTGPIPPSLGRMEALESLDLSSNKLGGRIPPELTNLTFLEVLNLSQNNLVGPIPQGKQFNTFEIDSYGGNPGLWGCPLPKKCRRIPESPPSSIVDHQDGDGDDDSRIAFIWKVAMMGYGCGVALGFSMGYIAFTTGRAWWIVRKIERDWQKNVTNWIRSIRGRRRRN